MFDQLAKRFSTVLNTLSFGKRLTEANIREALHEIRVALLEADVELSVVKRFTERLQAEVLGEAVFSSLSPGQAFAKKVHDALICTLGEAHAELNLRTHPPAVVLVTGLQGSGKTTTAAKLAQFIKARLKKTVLLTSTDIYRPAAMEQLKRLAEQHGLPFYVKETQLPDGNPVGLAQAALEQAKRQFKEVLIVDTAGRLHLDEDMMQSLRSIHQAVQPIESLLVVDSMMGQEALHVACAFHETLPVTGIVLTKTDGDAKCGAALSIWEAMHLPIKFMGTGEKIDALSAFYPERIAARLLDQGDVMTLVEDAQEKLDASHAQTLAKKLKKGRGFNLQDFFEQLQTVEKLGGMANLVSKLPGMQSLPDGAASRVSDAPLQALRVIIQSMTPQERRFPDIIKHSRKQRIARGAGVAVTDVNHLLKEFARVKKAVERFSKIGLGGLAKFFG